MPFTLAHPAVVLPFWKSTRWLHFPALALGSMAPDFEYFLRGKPVGIYGHTVAGIFWCDLPLLIAVFIVGKFLIGSPFAKRALVFSASVFLYSALLGIFSHLAWDSFTHAQGTMAMQIPVLLKKIHGFQVCRILQHGSSVAGLAVIAWFAFARRALWREKYNAAFFAVCAVVATVLFLAWWWFAPVTLARPGTLVVRAVDSAAAGFVVACLLQRLGKLDYRRGSA